ncbi:hypothetical protein MNBD_GAMMA12-3203 [hydrothermal vent metagenome]|uniref:Uncharacterized protein n=1 Tax=hydrothermal vent metagenome TaxID=652676 RepID=A0A3B0YAA9_9ZZZZ
MRHILTLLIFLSGVTNSHALVETFECTVKAVQEVSEKGEIIRGTEHLKSQIGSTFSVEKTTGEIRGGYFINNRYKKSVEVISLPAKGSYYAVSKSHGPHIEISYLYVNNFSKSIEKTFTYVVSGKWIYTGTCK